MSLAFISFIFLSSAYAVAPKGIDSTQQVKAVMPEVKPSPLSSDSPSPVPSPGASILPSLGRNSVGMAGAGPLTMSQIDVIFSTNFEEVVRKLRDPFKMPEAEEKVLEMKTDLERYSIAELKLVGILTGPKYVRAMLLAPDGKTYFVSEKMKIGLSGGIIRRIGIQGIQIREKTVNAIGEVEHIDREINLVAALKDPGALNGGLGGGMQGGGMQGGGMQGGGMQGGGMQGGGMQGGGMQGGGMQGGGMQGGGMQGGGMESPH